MSGIGSILLRISAVNKPDNKPLEQRVSLALCCALGTRAVLVGRMLTICVLGILTYELIIGGRGGSAFVWFFFVPPAIMFTLGICPDCKKKMLEEK